MLKLSRTGIGLLSAQYRSVLKKCFLLNLVTAGILLYSMPAQAIDLETGYLNASALSAFDDSYTDFGNQINTYDGGTSNVLNDGVHYAAGLAMAGEYTIERTGDLGTVAWIKNEGTLAIGYEYTDVTDSSSLNLVTPTITPVSGSSETYSAVIEHVHRETESARYNGGSVLDNLNHKLLPMDATTYQTLITNAYFADNINAYFTNTGSGATYGGVISNVRDGEKMGTMNISQSKFTQNYAKSNTSIKGGVIYNGSMETETNDSTASAYEAFASKAVLNSANNQYMVNGARNKLNDGNMGDDAVNSYGGVVYNSSVFNSVDDVYSGNASIATGNAFGGAIYNGIEKYNASEAAGGELYSTVGETHITGVSFVNNEAKISSAGLQTSLAAGGAVYNDSGTMTIGDSANKKTNFDSNRAQNSGSGLAAGGAVYNNAGMTISGEQLFSNNQTIAQVSGSATGGAIYNNSTLIMSGKQDFQSNSAQHAGTSGEADGGAIYNNGTLTSSGQQSYTSNNATDAGGAIYNKNGTFTNGGTQTFTSNTSVSGGAVYNNTTATMTNNGTQTFASNVASSAGASDVFGGAIYNAGTYNGLGGTLSSNNATTANTYEASGGAVYNVGTISAASNMIFQSNVAQTANGTAYGGAIYNASNDDSNGSISGLGGTFTTNKAQSTNGRARAGAIYTMDSTSTTLSETTFTGNEATGTSANGGAIYNGGTFTTSADKKLTFTANRASATADNATGGAIYNNGSMTFVYDVEFGNNIASITATSEEGGLVYGGAIDNAKQLTLANATFNGNQANIIGSAGTYEAGGGAIYNETTGSITATSGTIQNFILNSVQAAQDEVHGGAILNRNDGTISGLSGEFSQNTVTSTDARAYGGAIYNLGSFATNNTLSFAENHAKTTNEAGYGGAIYNGGTLSMIGTFTQNYVQGESQSAYGGAIYTTRGITLKSGSSFTANYATGNGTVDGGAIAIASAGDDTLISSTSIQNNYVSTGWKGRGGAIYNSTNGGLTTLVDTSLTGNYINLKETTDRDYHAEGGAIYNDAGVGTISRMEILAEAADVSISNNSIKVQTAAAEPTDLFYGGAIYNGQNGYMLISTGIEDNTLSINTNSALYGGAIYNAASGANVTIGGIDYSASLTVSAINGDIFIQNNKANENGGAIYNAVGTDGTTTLLATAATMNITGNSANNDGGAIHNSNKGTLLLQLGDGGKIRVSENSSTLGNGGAIYNDDATVRFSNSTAGTLNSAALRFRENTAVGGAAIYNGNGGILEGNLINTSIVFSDNTATDGLGGALYNEADSTVNLQIKGTSVVSFETTKDDVYNLGDITITGDLAAPTLPSISTLGLFEGETDSAQVILNSTFGGTGTYNISNTKLNVGSTGYIDYNPVMNLSDNIISMAGPSFINLSTKDTLSNNDFKISENAVLTYSAADSATEISDIVLANTIDNAGLIHVADNVLTSVQMNTLNSDEGTIKIDVRDATAETNPLKADVITINNRIYGTTNVTFDNADNVAMGVDDRIYFAKTQADQTLEDYAFNVYAHHDDYTISVGHEQNGTVYDWYLYREDQLLPFIDLPRAAVEQTRSIALQIGRTNSGRCNCHTDICNNQTYCRYESDEPKIRVWATPMYRYGKYKKPLETDIKLYGADFGIDYQPTWQELFGVFGSYRKGRYEYDGKDKKYTIFRKSKIDMTSTIFGAYYRRYVGDFYAVGALYGGKIDADIKSNNDVKASTDGITAGAIGEMGYDIRTSNRSILTPSVRATYDYIKFDDLKDTLGIKAKVDAIHDLELEAALKLEYQFNSEYELPTTGYIKPSVIQTIESGGKVKVKNISYNDTLENETLGRVEVGADTELLEDLLSVGAFGNYTFGSDYNAWGVGGNVRIVW